MDERFESGAAFSVGEAVYQTLRKGIIDLSLSPGICMSEKEISTKLQVSRTPVREAFIKLSKEALVEVLPQKGTVVSRINLDRVRQERFLRESLELSVLSLFVRQARTAEIKKMYKLVEKQRTALENKEEERFVEADNAFHQRMFLACGQSLSWQVIDNLGGHYHRVRRLTARMEIAKGVAGQHEQLLQAIEQGEAEQAREILTAHLRKLILEESDLLKEYPDYFDKGDKMEILAFDFKAGNSQLK